MAGKLSETVGVLARPRGAVTLRGPSRIQLDKPHLRILVVDDSATDRQVALALLSRLGQSADLAKDGMQAEEAVRERPYDIILMDVAMPVVDGLQATKHIKAGRANAAPRIIAMSGGRVATAEQCREAGMMGYIPKPVRLDRLSALLEACRVAGDTVSD